MQLLFTLSDPYFLKVQINLFVEGCRRGLCKHPDCLLLAVGCFLYGIDLAMHVLGKLLRDWWYLAL